MKTFEKFGRQASESAVGWLLRPRNHGRFCLLHEPEKGVFERQMFVQMKRPRSGRGEKRGERGCQGRVVGGIHLYGIIVLTNHYHASSPDLIRSENGFMTQLFIRLEKIAH